MPSDQSSLATRVRGINDAPASPSIKDVVAVLRQSSITHGLHLHSLDSPRERFVLVVLAAFPDADAAEIGAMTAMTVDTVNQAIRELLADGCIYISNTGRYTTASAAVVE